MRYQKLGEDIYIPIKNDLPLKDKTKIKFNYYLSSRINGNLIDLDITSKLFDAGKMYVRKSGYRVKLGEIENCVKANIIEHMLSLGLDESEIPKSLKEKNITNRSRKYSKDTV
ncbi:hypothetical protein GCM10023115_26320 [Pontixanthobacter gangjinensis]|uniref:Uncharacterized protein n=1 Tax=Christiangramia aestuarii TaxID=1028746 RepID=A0A7K1LM24_9FLAO|nr:hypothetical protein [Christiangramia aestuarii]MUP41869.1 hypothetical protein [Christiangramia aestuarii]